MPRLPAPPSHRSLAEDLTSWITQWNTTRVSVADGRATAVVIDGFLPPWLAYEGVVKVRHRTAAEPRPRRRYDEPRPPVETDDRRDEPTVRILLW